MHDDYLQDEGKQLRYPRDADSLASFKRFGNGFPEGMCYMNKKSRAGRVLGLSFMEATDHLSPEECQDAFHSGSYFWMESHLIAG